MSGGHGAGSPGAAATAGGRWNGAKVRLFGAVVGAVLAADIATKLVVQRTLRPYQQVEILGDYVRLTYIYNPGAAFGIYLGDYSRIIFLVLSLIALAALLAMYWVTPLANRVRLASIALVCGGAIGNLIDRVRSPRGVVDFLDMGVAELRWPVFNVADVAVTTGAILLALSLWQEEHGREREGGREPGGGG
ncbi:MAG: signal peptidase II [Longimicrobiales bacterium]|nr:signal peptidase II [Longimicrobiales bacterium]